MISNAFRTREIVIYIHDQLFSHQGDRHALE